MFKKTAAFVLFGLLSVTSVAAQGMTGCYLYTKDDFGGSQFSMGANSNVEDFGARRGWNDEISSVWVTSNCSAMLYEDSRFRGAGVLVTQRFTKLKIVNGGFNDRTSSARCTCS